MCEFSLGVVNTSEQRSLVIKEDKFHDLSWNEKLTLSPECNQKYLH